MLQEKQEERKGKQETQVSILQRICDVGRVDGVEIAIRFQFLTSTVTNRTILFCCAYPYFFFLFNF